MSTPRGLSRQTRRRRAWGGSPSLSLGSTHCWSEEEIGDQVWQGIAALVERGIGTKLFAQDFPVKCDDQQGTHGGGPDAGASHG